MKKIMSLLTVLILAGLGMQSGYLPALRGAPSAFKPTLNVDEHDIPVYTSPTNNLEAGKWTRTNALPPVPRTTNWPVTNLPPVTNWPSTNLPPMTNPPPLQPPGGR